MKTETKTKKISAPTAKGLGGAVTTGAATVLRQSGRAALVLLVMMLTTATAWADEREGHWWYSYDSGTNTLTITSYTGSDASVTTPTILGGHAVTAIGHDCFRTTSAQTYLTSVTVSEGVMTIGDGAFTNCSNLATISLPNSLTSIGKSAFTQCSALTSITIPNNVTEIGGWAFENSGLTDLYYAGTKAQWNNVSVQTNTFNNLSLTIHWQCTATYDMQGHGMAPSAQTVWSGSVLTAPTVPTATGYDFGGWYRNAACTQAFDFTAALDDNITLYAKWTALENTITFDLGGKGTAISDQTVTSGNTLRRPNVQFVGEAGNEEGIEGWYTDAARTVPYDFSTVVDRGFTLYAKWAAAGHVTMNVTGYNDNSGTCRLIDEWGQIFARQTDGTMPIMPGTYMLKVAPKKGYSFSGSYTLTNRSSGTSEMPYEIVGSGKKTYTYTLDLTEKDAAVNVTFSTQPILTVTTRAADESVLSQVTWSVKNNQNNSNYSNGSIIPYISDPNGAVASGFGIRLDVNLGTLSGYAFTATITDQGAETTTYKNSNDGTSFLIVPYGSIDIDLYVYEVPAITLQDNADNSTTLAENVGIAASSITLQGRTLYKDGDWNTLCLPFAVSSFAGTPLEGATVMSLKTSKSGGSGFNSETGVLTLNFTAATSITAGKAYIVKWTKPADYEGNESTYDISDPTFTDVSISSTAPSASTSNDKKVSFTGCYSPVPFEANDRTKLFLGAANTLYYPNAAMTVGACRAYFTVDLSTASLARAFVLNFGEDEATGIHEITDPTPDPSPAWEGSGCAWYSLDGRRLSGKPAKSGVYIVNGKKVVIK